MSRWTSRGVGSLLLAAGAGCAESPEPDLDLDPDLDLISELEPSMVMVGAEAFGERDHLVELIVHEGHVYTANSWYGVGVMRLEADGSLTVTDPGNVAGDGSINCTTIALHAESSTLFCSAERPKPTPGSSVYIERFDVSDPGHPTLMAPFAIERWSVRDLEVVGDTLLIHQFDDGLWTAVIDSEGELDELQRSAVEGNARASVAVDAGVVTVFADPDGGGTELRLFDGPAGDELARLALDGPPLGLSAGPDGQVVVALGSGGMAIVDVETDPDPDPDPDPDHPALTLSRSLHPPSVVTHGLVEGPLAVALSFSGAFVYRLGDPPTDPSQPGDVELVGFAAEGGPEPERRGSMVHGVFHDGELLVSDWTWVERWAIDEDGVIVDLELPRGLYLGPDSAARWPIRSFGDTPLRAELWAGSEHLLDVDLAGPGVRDVELPADVRATLFADYPRAPVNVRIHDPAVAPEGQPLATTSIVLLEQEGDEPLPPGVGESFPTLTLVDDASASFELPFAEGTRAILFTHDCTLQFYELEDLAWRMRGGDPMHRGTPVVVSDHDIRPFMARWAVDNLGLGLWGEAAPPELADVNAFLGGPLRDVLHIRDLPSGAEGTDYVIDGAGVVVGVTRLYRGEWSLVPEI